MSPCSSRVLQLSPRQFRHIPYPQVCVISRCRCYNRHLFPTHFSLCSHKGVDKPKSKDMVQQGKRQGRRVLRIASRTKNNPWFWFSSKNNPWLAVSENNKACWLHSLCELSSFMAATWHFLEYRVGGNTKVGTTRNGAQFIE